MILSKAGSLSGERFTCPHVLTFIGEAVLRKAGVNKTEMENRPTEESRGLDHDYRSWCGKCCRVAAPGEAVGARFSGGSVFDDWRSCADSISPG